MKKADIQLHTINQRLKRYLPDYDIRVFDGAYHYLHSNTDYDLFLRIECLYDISLGGVYVYSSQKFMKSLIHDGLLTNYINKILSGEIPSNKITSNRIIPQVSATFRLIKEE